MTLSKTEQKMLMALLEEGDMSIHEIQEKIGGSFSSICWYANGISRFIMIYREDHNRKVLSLTARGKVMAQMLKKVLIFADGNEETYNL